MKKIIEKVERIAIESLDELLDFLECMDADQINCECNSLKKYGFTNLNQYGGIYLDKGRDWIFNIEPYDNEKFYIDKKLTKVSDIKSGKFYINWGKDIFFIFYPDRN